MLFRSKDDVDLAPQYSPLYEDLLNRGFPIAGSASVAVQDVALKAQSLLAPISAGSTAPPIDLGASSISLSAEDATQVVNASGAFTFGTRTGNPDPDDVGDSSSSGLGTLAGAASVNLISRQVSTLLSGVSLSGASPASVSLSSSTSPSSLTMAGAISLSKGVASGTSLEIGRAHV